ncbi:tetratricopeptide repeat protein [Sphaerospermopsis aphanizomenoides BCCUSP55]|nr:tetratricopeptide repeat protein [Sphaerospermopsis aphanizomenoides BCCUSP55]
MKNIISQILLLSLTITPLSFTLIAQPSWGQAQVSLDKQAEQLMEKGRQLAQQQEYRQAIPMFQQVLILARQLQNKQLEADVLAWLGFCYSSLGEKQKALEFYNQALPLLRAVGDRSGEARTLNNIGGVYDSLGEKQKALDFYNQALPMYRAVGDRSGEAVTLSNIGAVYSSLGEKQKALEFYNQALPLRRAVGDRSGEATTLNNIGLVYDSLGEKQKALEFYNQALPLRRAVGDRSGEANTLNNIGAVYDDLGEKQKALEFYNQALPMRRAVGDRSGEANTLNNIGAVYDDLGEKQKALEFYNLALPMYRAVGDRSGEAITLGNIGVLYQDRNQLPLAVRNLQESSQIFLQMRQGLQRENRQKFLQQYDWSGNFLVEALIDNKQEAQAFEWVNLFSTAELADYSRLINAKVANPQAQIKLDQWNQQNQSLESQRQKLQDEEDPILSQQIRELEAKIYKDAEDISRQFPEVAELLESNPADIQKLKSSIPAGTVVVQPVLLNNSLAIFIITQNNLSVVKQKLDPKTNFNKILNQYLQQLNDESNSEYIETGSQPLYDLLIRPIEAKIQALSPQQLSIIPTGNLRRLPFETLYDSKTNKFLIAKYPVNYLTRISPRTLQTNSNNQTINNNKKLSVLAFGNPVPRPPQHLPGAETEVKNIKQLIPASDIYIHKNATLEKFKTQSFRFPFLHLATHGCFQNQDCKKIQLKNNTLLFADTQFKIADAALLGLKGTKLLTLSACQTANQTSENEQGLTGIAYIFERAGAEAVMGSLWAVEDKSTQVLMVAFYQNLQQGKSKGEALRQAKLKLIKDYPHPFYWSAFILIGDAR